MMLQNKINLQIEFIEALKTLAQYGHLKNEMSSLIDVGTTNYIKFFEEEVLDSLVSLGGATCRFYEGPYGSGKSHLLSLLYQLGIKKGYIIYSTDLSDELRLDDWHSITREILANMEMVINGERIRSLPNILKALSKGSEYKVDKLQQIQLPHEGIKKAIISAMKRNQELLGNKWTLLSDYILGEKITLKMFEQVGLGRLFKGYLTQRNSELFLKTVLTSLHLIGIPGIMLLFDENDKTLMSTRANPSKKYKKAANLMRRLIDGTTNGNLVGTVIIFTILPTFIEYINLAYPALGQRLSMNRDISQGIGWRSPVLPIQVVNDIGNPEDFLKKLIEVLLQRFQEVYRVNRNLEEEMYLIGEEVLQEHAGTDYRRPLLKRLASLLIEEMEGGEVR